MMRRLFVAGAALGGIFILAVIALVVQGSSYSTWVPVLMLIGVFGVPVLAVALVLFLKQRSSPGESVAWIWTPVLLLLGLALVFELATLGLELMGFSDAQIGDIEGIGYLAVLVGYWFLYRIYRGQGWVGLPMAFVGLSISAALMISFGVVFGPLLDGVAWEMPNPFPGFGHAVLFACQGTGLMLGGTLLLKGPKDLRTPSLAEVDDLPQESTIPSPDIRTAAAA